MISSAYKDETESSNSYIYYYDNDYNSVTAISKIDENNLKQIASDIGIDYIQMSKTENIDYKIKGSTQSIIHCKCLYYETICNWMNKWVTSTGTY